MTMKGSLKVKTYVYIQCILMHLTMKKMLTSRLSIYDSCLQSSVRIATLLRLSEVPSGKQNFHVQLYSYCMGFQQNRISLDA